jgi:hypothetical protein
MHAPRAQSEGHVCVVTHEPEVLQVCRSDPEHCVVDGTQLPEQAPFEQT